MKKFYCFQCGETSRETYESPCQLCKDQRGIDGDTQIKLTMTGKTYGYPSEQAGTVCPLGEASLDFEGRFSDLEEAFQVWSTTPVVYHATGRKKERRKFLRADITVTVGSATLKGWHGGPYIEVKKFVDGLSKTLKRAEEGHPTKWGSINLRLAEE